MPLSLLQKSAEYHTYCTGYLPVHKGVFDVIECRIEEDACVIPRCAFDTNRFVQTTDLLKFLVDDGDIVFAE